MRYVFDILSGDQNIMINYFRYFKPIFQKEYLLTRSFLLLSKYIRHLPVTRES